jgi:tetratricopeptide (TPR) repeat protein
MAYWGEAMTWTHPLWDEQEVDSGRAVLARLAPTAEARRARAKTPRERGYLEAVELLYGDGPKPLRDTLYSLAMERLSAAHPRDDEARSLYALSLMGLSQGVRDLPTYMRAGAIGLDIFQRRPDHPGAAHYVIHAFDDPTHAPLGLPAARAYSRIAPGAAHAQHMTSHIFLALGMWDETVAANVVASGPEREKWTPHHYTYWLEYALLQQGRHRAARGLLDTVRMNLKSPGTPRARHHLILMRAQYLMNTERWNDNAAEWTVDSAELYPALRAVDAFALGYTALRRGDRDAAERRLAMISSLRAATRDSADGGDPASQRMEILERELRGLLRLADGDTAGALTAFQEAAAIEDAVPVDFGPPDLVKPTHELLGEVLLAGGHAADAQREFSRALALAPRRSLSLLGLARAARAAGDTQTAERASQDLARVWAYADAELPAKAELSNRSIRATGQGGRAGDDRQRD